MAIRTAAGAVQALLGPDWDRSRSVQAFILTASRIVDRVVTCITSKGFSIDAEEQELMERWLAAWLYTKSDPTYSSKSTLGASGSFNRVDTAYLDPAKALDPSGGCLMAAVTGQRASGAWLGRPPSEQTDYVERN